MNYDQLLLATASSNQHSTPLRKTRTSAPKMQNLSPNASSLEQQKDSRFDEDSQERFVKIKRSNKITSRNMKENIERPLSPQFKTRFVKSDDSCDIQKQQLLSSKENRIKDVHSKSYNNILNKDNRQKDEEKEEKDLQLNQVNQDTKTYLINQEEKTCMASEDMCDIQKQLLPKVKCIEILNKKYKVIDKEEMIDAPMASETDNEEDNANYVSPETKKRLQQRARLNLVASSDSSESSDEEIRKKVEPLTRCTYEKNNSFQTTASPLKETQYCENVYNDDDRSEDIKEDVENFQLRLSESNGSCNNEESMNQFPRDKRSRSLEKENMIAKSNQSEDRTSAEVGTRYESRCEQNAEAST